jgi:hypothetical protein
VNDVAFKHFGEGDRQRLSAEATGRQRGVDETLAEEHLLVLQRLQHRLLFGYVGLRTVLYAHVAQLQRHFSLVQQQTASVSASVHQVDLGDAADCALALGVCLHGCVQDFVVGDVLVGGDDAEDD